MGENAIILTAIKDRYLNLQWRFLWHHMCIHFTLFCPSVWRLCFKRNTPCLKASWFLWSFCMCHLFLLVLITKHPLQNSRCMFVYSITFLRFFTYGCCHSCQLASSFFFLKTWTIKSISIAVINKTYNKEQKPIIR